VKRKNLSSNFKNKLTNLIRHSGVVIYNREYYWGGVIQVGAPVSNKLSYGRSTTI